MRKNVTILTILIGSELFSLKSRGFETQDVPRTHRQSFAHPRGNTFDYSAFFPPNTALRA